MIRRLRLFRDDEHANVVIYIAGALMILGLIAADLLYAARRDLQTNQVGLKRLELENANEAGARLGAALAGSPAFVNQPVHGFDCAYGRSHLTVTVRPVSGLFDINSGRVEDLEILLRSLAIEEPTLARVVAAYRAKTERVNAASREEDLETRLRFPRPYFNQIGDFRYLDGVSDALFEDLRIYLTANSFFSRIQYIYAPPGLRSYVAETYGPHRLNSAGSVDRLDTTALQLVARATDGAALDQSQVFILSEPTAADGVRLILDDFRGPASPRAELVNGSDTPVPGCLSLLSQG